MDKTIGPVVSFRGVSKAFYKGKSRIPALEDIDFDVDRGEFIAIIGPSGCGKSTLLNMVSGLLSPSSGTVLYGGEAIEGVNTKVGYVTQSDSLFPWRTVRQNIRVALEVRPTKRSEREALVEGFIERVGLDGFADHYPAELSGGMRKRVSLARTLIYDPETLVMDEPFGALDAQLKLVLQEELLRLWGESKKTVLFVTHDLAEAVTMADRVVIMSARPGRVRWIQQIPLSRPRDVFGVRYSEEFGKLHNQLWEILQTEVRQGEDV